MTGQADQPPANESAPSPDGPSGLSGPDGDHASPLTAPTRASRKDRRRPQPSSPSQTGHAGQPGPRPRRARRAIPVGLALTTAAALGIGTGIAEAHKTVVLVRDGRKMTVETFSGTVAGALDEGEVSLARHDKVQPQPGEQLADGTTITIRTGKGLTYVGADGEEKVISNAVTAGEAAREAQERDEGSVLVSRSERRDDPALRLALTPGEPVDLAVAGEVTRVPAGGGDIAALLAAQDVEIENLDTVRLGRGADGVLRIDVTKCHEERRTRHEPVAFAKREKKDATLLKGTRKVTQKGATGKAEITELLTITNGKVTDTELVSREQVKEPVAEITSIGTKPPPEPKMPASAGGGWAALARCESGGRASVVSSNGMYHGLYQFSVATWRSVGGKGLPSQASPAEQTKRAKILYQRAGAGQWPVCGRHLR